MFGALVLVAFNAFYILDYLESLLGGICSILTSIVFPALFHLILFRKSLSTPIKILDAAIVVVGLAALVYIVVSDSLSLRSQLSSLDGKYSLM